MADNVTLPNGQSVPKLGLGTWGMGERGGDPTAEARAIAHALDQGVGLLDTAEMYGAGGAEEVIARALEGRTEAPFIVSKVYPHNASRQGVIEACENSLRRLQIERIDLYLLHWRGAAPFAETISGFERLMEAGKIGAWGVSNMDADDMAELWAAPGGEACQVDQVLYNLVRRWPEGDLAPALAAKGVPMMAYSPLEQAHLAGDAALKQIAADAGVAPLELALAWVLARENVIAIPKSARPDRIDGFIRAAGLNLGDDLLAALDAAFPAPGPGAGLEML